LHLALEITGIFPNDNNPNCIRDFISAGETTYPNALTFNTVMPFDKLTNPDFILEGANILFPAVGAVGGLCKVLVCTSRPFIYPSILCVDIVIPNRKGL
jgi:cobalamin synthase